MNEAQTHVPGSPQALAQLDELLTSVRGIARGQGPSKALEALEAAPQALQAHALWHYVRGALACRLDDFERGAQAFARAIAISPGIPEYYGNLGAALIERARRAPVESPYLREAVAALETAALLGPRYPAVFDNLGVARLLSGDCEGALAAFDKALGIDASDTTGLCNKAIVLGKLGDKAAARALLEKALQLSPGLEPARAELRRLASKP